MLEITHNSEIDTCARIAPVQTLSSKSDIDLPLHRLTLCRENNPLRECLMRVLVSPTRVRDYA